MGNSFAMIFTIHNAAFTVIKIFIMDKSSELRISGGVIEVSFGPLSCHKKTDLVERTCINLLEKDNSTPIF